ncbi:hypothetical protein Q7P37_002873 [Cladosporium fusiforme]
MIVALAFEKWLEPGEDVKCKRMKRGAESTQEVGIDPSGCTIVYTAIYLALVKHSWTMALEYHIREASSRLGDEKKFLEFCDSQLPYLAQMGSEGQWGTDSLAASEKSQKKYRDLVDRSEKELSWSTGWIRFFFLEIEADATALPDNAVPFMTLHDPQQARVTVPIAAMILEGSSPDYVRPKLQHQDDQDPFLYIRFLVSNRDVGSLSKGAGQMLLDHAENVAKTLPVRRICLDGWNGNDRLLLKYYERLGYAQLGDVDADGWPATVMEKRLD